MTVESRVGVVVLDHDRPLDAQRAARSAVEPSLDVRVLIVENGAGEQPPSPGRLRLSENRGFAGGMNAGVQQLVAEGCDRILLLNNDATLEPGCLARLARAVDDPGLGAAGPVILRAGDGLIESRGIDVDRRWGGVRLVGSGRRPEERDDVVDAAALSGAVLMLSVRAWEKVGPLDEELFFSFEDVDWSLRARSAGLRLAVCLGARARHAGSATLGRQSPERFYYAARNHVRLVERHGMLAQVPRPLRPVFVVARNLVHAATQRQAPPAAAVRAVLAGWRDARRGRYGRGE